MNARFLCAAALVGSCVTASASANAVPYHVVYDATITDGSDTDNLFGLVGQDLAGLSFRADVTYVTSIPGTRKTSADFDEVTGGEGFGTASVVSAALFTIGTKSFTLFPSYYSDVYTSADFLDAYGYDTLGNSFQAFILPALAGPTNLEAPFSSDGIGDPGGAATQYSYAAIGNDLIDFEALHVTVSAVPEPATWAMMLVGFGGMGYTMRRRRGGRRTAIA